MPAPFEATPLFDPTAIERLRKVGGDQEPGFVAEMALLFLEESGKLVADLRQACHDGDWKTVARIAHSLKSSSATLGLIGLRDACVSLELNALKANAPSLATNTPSLAPRAETLALAASVFDQFEQAIPLLKRLS